MNKRREQAIKLRLLGKSYGEIQKILYVPKSTLSGWLSGIHLSKLAHENIRQRTNTKSSALLIQRNKLQTHLAQQRARRIRREAAQKIQRLDFDLDRGLFYLGIALYWAEGHKRPIRRNGKNVTYHPVSLTNSDPLLIKLFLRFLREFCYVQDRKIRVQLRIFPHQNSQTMLDYWMSTIGLERENFRIFRVTAPRSSQSKRPYHQLPYGVAQLRVSDTKLFHEIMGYLEGIQKMV